MAKSFIQKMFRRAALAVCLTVATSAVGSFANFDNAYAAGNNAGISQTQNPYVFIARFEGNIAGQSGNVALFYNMNKNGYKVVYVSEQGQARELETDKRNDGTPNVMVMRDLASGVYIKCVGPDGKPLKIDSDQDGTFFNGQPGGDASVSIPDDMERKALAALGVEKQAPAEPDGMTPANPTYAENETNMQELMRFAQSNGIGSNLDVSDMNGMGHAILSKLGVKNVAGEINIGVSGKQEDLMFFDFANDVQAANAFAAKVGGTNVGAYDDPKTGKSFKASIKVKISELNTAIMRAALLGAKPVAAFSALNS